MAKHYYISFNGADYSEIFPMGSPICNYSQWEGTRVWREELEKIKLVRSNNATVFDTLESYFTDKTKFDTELEIEVYTGVRATGTVYFQGLFSISDSELDRELKTFEIKPRVNDDYFDIAEKYDVKHELDISSTILEQIRIGYSSTVALSAAWDNPLVSTAYSTLDAVGGSVGTAIAPANGSDAGNEIASVSTGDIIIVDVTAKTGAVPIAFDVYNAVPASVTQEGAKTITAAPATLAFTMDKYVGIPYIYMGSSAGTTALEFTARKILNANDLGAGCELLMDFLEEFAADSNYMYLTAFTGNVVSTFINNDSLPTGAPSTISTFMGANPNGNYVTEAATNDLNTTFLGLLRLWFTGTAEKSIKMSFKDIADHLRDIFQVYWFIDYGGNLRFEHEKYFVKLVDDSTPITVPATGEVDNKLLKYEKGLIASVEQFTWPQAGYTDFVGKNVIYNNFNTTNNSKSYTVSQMTTDMRYVMTNTGESSDSGLGLYHGNLLTGLYDKGDGTTIYEIAHTAGALSSVVYENGAFSWANLHEDYWTWSRMAIDATMNGTSVTMDSSVRFLQQDGVRFFYSTAIDPYTQFNTTLTGGAPVNIRRDLDTDYIEITIGYDPYKL